MNNHLEKKRKDIVHKNKNKYRAMQICTFSIMHNSNIIIEQVFKFIWISRMKSVKKIMGMKRRTFLPGTCRIASPSFAAPRTIHCKLLY